jgi:hypothetical protein
MVINGTEVVFIYVTVSWPMVNTHESAKNSRYVCENGKKGISTIVI